MSIRDVMNFEVTLDNAVDSLVYGYFDTVRNDITSFEKYPDLDPEKVAMLFVVSIARRLNELTEEYTEL